MTVRLIAAMSSEGIIGIGNDLPWSLKDDLKHFKALTMGRAVVMGSKTFDSSVCDSSLIIAKRRRH